MPIPPDRCEKLETFLSTWDRNPDDFEKFVVVEHATSWTDFLQWLSELEGSWCFRGHREASWFLDTVLDRDVRKVTKDGHYHLDRETQITELLFRFQQQAHLYVDNPPPRDDLSSWFALMQHHGVPTRLLDWTESAYVGLYFAFESESQERGDSALWAMDMDWLDDNGRVPLFADPAATKTGMQKDAWGG